MAGICAGAGLTTDDNGYLAVLGARPGAFPVGCDLLTENGLRSDPGTGSLWVAPPPAVRLAASDPAAVAYIYPTGPGIYSVPTPLAEAVTAPGCSTSTARISLTGGMVTMRASSSNLWLIERQLTVKVGGITVLSIPWQTVAEIETPSTLSGGIIGTGHPPDTWAAEFAVGAGSTVEASVAYRLNVASWHTHASNRVDFRSPVLAVELLTVPLTVL